MGKGKLFCGLGLETNFAFGTPTQPIVVTGWDRRQAKKRRALL
jgi:hypothetical protein